MFLRERTAFPVVLYGLYLVFLGLSFMVFHMELCGCLEVDSAPPKIQKAIHL
jgi:Na+-transporting methylmalonyl-CoA/oxaloacetate decarboxylase gamma subunit